MTACVSPARRLRWWLLDVATRWTGRPGWRGTHHWYGGGHPPTEREMTGWSISLRPGQTWGREFQKTTHRYLGNDKWRTL